MRLRQIDEWPGDWRIDCISTPTTIYRDLTGGSRASRARQRSTIVGVRSEPVEEMSEFPELHMLSGAGVSKDLFRVPRG